MCLRFVTSLYGKVGIHVADFTFTLPVPKLSHRQILGPSPDSWTHQFIIIPFSPATCFGLPIYIGFLFYL